MQLPPIPPDEAERLAALDSLGLLHTPPEERFDRISRIAARLFEVPIVLITLVADDYQWFKTCVGLDRDSTERSVSFCAHAILNSTPLIIRDALEDARFADNPLVVGEPGIRFYAGQPLSGPGGHRLGTLCLIDRQPRELSAADEQALADLSAWAERELNSLRFEEVVRRQQAAEQALVASQHFIQRVAEATPHLLYVVDLAAQQMIYANRPLSSLLGDRVATVRAPECSLLPAQIHPDDQQRACAHMAQLLRLDEGEVVEIEYRVGHADGGWRWVALREAVFARDATGAPAQLIGSAQDITQRKQAEAALQQSEARHRALLSALPDVILRLSRDGHYLDYYRAGGSHGHTQWPLIGQSIREVLPLSIAEQSLTMIQRALETRSTQVYEYQLARPHGVRDYEARVAVNGEDEVLVIVRDITDHKHIERMKNEFISMVSHELRTPLTSIRGALGLVAGGMAGAVAPQAQTMIDIAHKNSERLVRLINDILDIEKIESGGMTFEMRPQPLQPLLWQAIDANRNYAGQFGVTLLLEAELGDALVAVDADRLLQVLTNLLGNAAKFSPAGATVRLKALRPADAPGMLRIAVIDQGPGIPAAFESRIFQKFAQADSSSTRRRGGTGLGLSISRAIVERLGGRIGFSSPPEGGAVFSVDLPEWQSVARAEPPQAHVLICEDDPEIAAMLSAMLITAGFRADTARSAAQARELLRQRRYRAMTLDLTLPDQDGIGLLRELRAAPTTHDLPIIIVSALCAGGPETLRGDALAIIDWLELPIEIGRLTAALRQALRQSGERPHVLHIEDDLDIVQVVAEVLAPMAVVSRAVTLEQARRLLATQRFDLIILDVQLPDGQGLDLLPQLRDADGQSPPVVVFSATDMTGMLSRQVSAALVKSRTSNQMLQLTITRLIAQRERE